MVIVTLRLSDVKVSSATRPTGCRYCANPVLQRWGGQFRAVKDPHVHQALIYRYRRTKCQRTFRHYPPGLSPARQSQRLIHLAALCWG